MPICHFVVVPFIADQTTATGVRVNICLNALLKIIPLKFFYYRSFFETWRD